MTTKTAHLTLYARFDEDPREVDKWIREFMAENSCFSDWNYSPGLTPDTWHVMDRNKAQLGRHRPEGRRNSYRPLVYEREDSVVAIRVLGRFHEKIPATEGIHISLLCDLSSRVFSSNGMFVDLKVHIG